MSNKKKFEAGFPFETDNGTFKYLETPYGMPYVARLYSGVWIFGFHVKEVLENRLNYEVPLIDGKVLVGMKYDEMKFV
jgi:hypothetical protein